MRWLADECVAAALVVELRAADHDVIYTAELMPSASDTDVIRLALHESRLLLTEDKDFGAMVFHQGRPVPGLVFLRIDPDKRQFKWPRLRLAVSKFGESLFGRYTVIEQARFRSRPLR